MQEQHQQQMARLRHNVEALLKKNWDPITQEQLDDLLKKQPRALLDEALHSWVTREENNNTLLTNAVRQKQFEVAAILLYHGADAHQPCPPAPQSNAP
jgi:hypothetical protein